VDVDPSDLLGRLQRFAEAGNPHLVMAALLGMLVLIVLAALDMRMTLIALNLLALVFADAANDTLASGATLARWAIVALIAATNVWGSAWPGLPVILLAGYGLLAVIVAPIVYAPMFAIQSGLLMIVTTLGFGSALARRLRSFDDALTLLKLLLIVAGVWVLVSLWWLPEMVSGFRFSGAGTSAPLFAITGGLFLPIALWGSFDVESRGWRWYSRGLGMCTLFLLLLSGQRTGAIAGALGCAPMLLRRGATVFRVSVVTIALVIAAAALVIHFYPAQTAFVVGRYEERGLSGRQDRWMLALRNCLQSPFIPHGAGSSDDLVGIGFHNAFLVAWFEGGLIGLALFLGSFVLMIARGSNLLLRSDQPRVISAARVSLSVVCVLVLSAFAEQKLASPSNLLMTLAVVNCTILYRLYLPGDSDSVPGPQRRASVQHPVLTHPGRAR
jgi:O-antigen ligase